MKHILIFSLFVLLSLSLNISAKAKSGVGDTSVQDLATLKTAVENHGNTIATVQNQVNEMVNTFQTMNGDIARDYKKNKDQDTTIRDMQTRMQVLEDKILLLTGQLQELKGEGLLPAKASKRFDEYQEYSKGLAYMNGGLFDKAVVEFKKFQDANPKSVFQSYAQFWIGQSYFMQGDYPMAVKKFQEVLSQNSKSAKAPTAVFQQGMSFFNLQSLDDAKAFFRKVIGAYPQTPEAVQASAQIARIEEIQALQRQKALEMQVTQ